MQSTMLIGKLILVLDEVLSELPRCYEDGCDSCLWRRVERECISLKKGIGLRTEADFQNWKEEWKQDEVQDDRWREQYGCDYLEEDGCDYLID